MNKESKIGKDTKPEARCSYDKVNSGDWKTLHVIPHDRTKGGENRGGVHYGAYAPKNDCNKKSER